MRTFTNEQGRPCREFVLRMKTDGNVERSTGVSCQQPNGQWEITRQST